MGRLFALLSCGRWSMGLQLSSSESLRVELVHDGRWLPIHEQAFGARRVLGAELAEADRLRCGCLHRFGLARRDSRSCRLQSDYPEHASGIFLSPDAR